MTVFNSLGSNYNFRFALKALAPRLGHHHLKLREFLGAKYGGEVILLHRGREAIELAIRIIQKIDNLPQGTGVIITGFTCLALYQAVVKAGGIPFYLDIDEQRLNFSPEKLKAALETNPNIKVVIIQNTLGYPAATHEIAKICTEKGALLIEDLAHSVGSVYLDGKETGAFGDFAVLSFSQDKIIDSVSGGALIVRNSNYRIRAPYPLTDLGYGAQLMERFYPLFTWKIRKLYITGIGKLIHLVLKKLHLLSQPIGKLDLQGLHLLPGWNCYLAKSQFNKLPSDLAHRRRIAHIYKARIGSSLLSPLLVEQINYANNLRFPIFTDKRDGLIEYLKRHKIFVSDIWYDAPVSPQRYLHLTNYQLGQCPVAEKLSLKILNLPTHINVSEKEAERIAELINAWVKQKA